MSAKGQAKDPCAPACQDQIPKCCPDPCAPPPCPDPCAPDPCCQQQGMSGKGYASQGQGGAGFGFGGSGFGFGGGYGGKK
ncbi:uncharacterized protein RB166_018986 [Leptodactylus fuscus]